MTRLALLIDVTRCSGCYNCFLACRDEHYGNDYPGYSAPQPLHGQFWMQIKEVEGGKYPRPRLNYIAVPCQNCQNAPCIDAAKDGAVYRRDDGIVMIDPVKAKGQDQIVASCPYRVIYWNDEKNIPQKCTFCAHLLDAGWKEPRCVEACPTAALKFGDLDDPNSEVAKLVAAGKVEILHPEYNMKEKVSYIGLPKRFIAGTVVFGDTDECADKVTVTISDGQENKTLKTNNYGDFELDGLPSNKEYTVGIRYTGYKAQTFEVFTRDDVYMGDIFLTRE